MNRKNILISIAVLGIGIILYKLLLGLVLPIALFVSLGYVLKFLLKGSESDSVKEVSKIFTNSENSSSIDNIVEIKPIEEEKPVEEDQPIEKEKPVEEDQPIEKEKPVEEDQPIEKEKPVEEDKP